MADVTTPDVGSPDGADDEPAATPATPDRPSEPAPEPPTVGLLAEVEAACHVPLLTAWDEVAERIDRGVVGALRDGLARHTELVTSTGLDGEPPTEWKERADRLLEYRRGLSGALLEPLAERMEDDGPAVLLAHATTEAVAAAGEAVSALPEEADDVWPDAALEPAESDRLGRRVGKGFARIFSAARKPGHERTVPLRRFAARHVATFVAPAVDGATEAAMIDWASWSRDLETAWNEWGEAVLPALVRAELPDAEDSETLWATVRDGANALQGRLETLVAVAPTAAFVASLHDTVGDCRRVAAADLAVAASFLLPLSEHPAFGAHLPRTTAAEPALDDWEDGVAARMRLYQAVLSILAGATAVQRRLLWRFREKCLGEIQRLPEIADELEALATRTRDRGASGDLVARLEELARDVETTVTPSRAAIPDAELVDETIVQGADSTVEGLLAIIRQAPSTLRLHGESPKLPSSKRTVETRPVALQELARQSFDALRVERIRSAPLALVSDIDEMRGRVRELPEVYAFAHEAALKELEAAEEDAEVRAVGLVGEALESMASSLRNEMAKLGTDVDAVQAHLAEEVSEASLGLVDRVSAGRMHAQLLAARSRFADLRARLVEVLGPRVQQLLRRIAYVWTVAKRTVTRGFQRGSELVTGPTSEASDASRSVRALADAPALVQGLPLVYQRLFTLQPLADGALLAGRSAEIAEGMGRWRRWRAEDGVPLIVKGRQGSGITSLINVLAGTIEAEGATVKRLPLDRRVTDEGDLTAVLAEALGMEPADTLDDLAAAAFRQELGVLPDAIAVDNLEHLYLRVPGGTNLIERFLTFMAETEPRTFWIGGVTTSAWQLVVTSEPSAVSQVDVLDLQPLSPESMREAIELRHRRSGLAVRFEEPEQGRRLLKRRLRRMRDAEGYREILEDDFFQRLMRTSNGHLQLAIFQWLMAADFESGGGVLMRQPERPDFAVLDALDLTQNFTLKAFLEHRTLSLAEHDRIFRLPRQESYQIFESLGNRHLIEAVGEDEDAPDRSEIEEGFRYRVRPLLTGAVMSHLRGRNIVH